MKFSDAIDDYIRDMRQEGRLNSDASERTYRDILNLHCDDINNRDPRTVGRDDIKRTLARWENPNTIRGRRATLVSFYDWTMEEGHRKDNPARQTRRPRKRPTNVYRLTSSEVAAIWTAPNTDLERRAIRIGLGAGLRSNELRHLQGRHFQRPGLIWVSSDIAKGGRERWVPVIHDLAQLVAEIVATVAVDEYVISGQRNLHPGNNRLWAPDPTRPMGATTIYKLVIRVAQRAGIDAHIHPHLMRHAYADHIAKHAGIRVAQSMLGHADIRTTRGYIDAPTIDELVAASAEINLLGLPPHRTGSKPFMETVGIEPTVSPVQPLEPKTSSQHLALVLIGLREAFIPIIRNGGAA